MSIEHVSTANLLDLIRRRYIDQERREAIWDELVRRTYL